MWIIHEPKKVALWKKRHFEEKNGECAACLKYSVLIFVEKKYIKCNIWRVVVRPSYIWDARFLKANSVILCLLICLMLFGLNSRQVGQVKSSNYRHFLGRLAGSRQHANAPVRPVTFSYRKKMEEHCLKISFPNRRMFEYVCTFCVLNLKIHMNLNHN
jgi:hypothetical protein